MKKWFLVFLLFSMQAFAESLSSYKSTCEELGFKPKTEKFGECVLKLKKRDTGSNQNNNVISNTNDIEELKRQHQALAEKQFLEIQRQNDILQKQYEHQVAMYSQQQEAQRKEKERKKNIYLMQLGGYMMEGKSFGDASRMAQGLPPAYNPQPPAFQPLQDYRVTLPNGSFYTCRYDANIRRANCF